MFGFLPLCPTVQPPPLIMKHKVVAPANARYRCGFPGCSKRYVSTDGVRKHARKMHSDWLRSVDVHSECQSLRVKTPLCLGTLARGWGNFMRTW